MPTAAELLEDGMDAAADHATESARRIFGQLIADYPDSPEASRARKALITLDQGADQPEVHAAIRADEAERTAQYRRAFLIDVGDRVFFAESSAEIGGRARTMIANEARWLKARPDLTVTIIGRADDGGDRMTAHGLSERRAEAVRDRLVASGVDTQRIDLKAVGDQDRLALCSSPLCQAQNRNAEVLINDWQAGGSWQTGQQTAPPGPPRSSVDVGPPSGTSDQVPQ